MDTKFLPRELVSRCLNYVVAYHKQAGHSNLAQQLWDRETMVFLSLHKDMMEILGAAVTSFRMRRLLWLLALVVIALVVFINWWIALALMPVIFAERYFARRERESYMWLAALMLAYEMLVKNFAGLATRFPDAWQQASSNFMQGYDPSHWSRFLDIYLPRRDEADPETLAAFASFE